MRDRLLRAASASNRKVVRGSGETRSRLAAVSVCALLAGCSTGGVYVGASSGVPGSSLQISSNSALGALIAAGIVGAAWHGSEVRPSDPLWMGYDSTLQRPPPPRQKRDGCRQQRNHQRQHEQHVHVSPRSSFLTWL